MEGMWGWNNRFGRRRNARDVGESWNLGKLVELNN